MRKSAVTVVIALIAALILPTTSSAAPKAGAKCPKKGKIQVYKSYEYKCVKKSGKLVWSKGNKISQTPAATPEISPTPEPTPEATPTPDPTSSPAAQPTPSQSILPEPQPSPSTPITPENFLFGDLCEKDPFIPEQWGSMEEMLNPRGTECSWPYRIVKKAMPSVMPKTSVNESAINANMCKLPGGEKKNALVAWPQHVIDFWTKYQRHPSKKSIVQLVPIYSLDAPDNGKNPAEDYKPYLDFLKDWVDHASDGQGKLEIRSPSRYIEFQKNIRGFKLTHERPESIAINFREALEKEILPKLDMRGANIAIVLLPTGSDFSLTQQVGLGQSRIGNDFVRLTIFPPFTLTAQLGYGANFIHPAWWLHEMHHATAGLDDMDLQTDDGLYFWGLMSWSATEMLGWQKWLMGLWGDEKVNCADLSLGGTYWLAPSTYQTNKKKLLVLPISNTKVIVIESMRAGGLNYKMPNWMEGVLIYGVDNTTVDHHTGTFVVKPQNRILKNPTLKGLSRIFVNSDAALKQGEYAIYGGYKITVVESGAFGDVVRVEKA